MKNVNRFLCVILAFVASVMMSLTVFADTQGTESIGTVGGVDAPNEVSVTSKKSEQKTVDTADTTEADEKDEESVQEKSMTKNQLMIKSFQIMGVGMAGIFIVIAAIALCVGLLTKMFPVKKD